MDVSDELHT